MAKALVSICVGKIRHPLLIRVSNATPKRVCSGQHSAGRWDGTASFGSPCAAVLSGCQGFSSIFLPGRGLWLSLPAGQPSAASCARRRPYGEPRYRICMCVFSFGASRTTSLAAIAAIRRLRNVIVVLAHDPAHPRDGVVVPVPVDKCDDFLVCGQTPPRRKS